MKRSKAVTSIRQPVHVLYGGAHLFSSGTIPKMGLLATRQFLAAAPDCFTLADALALPEAQDLPRTENGRMSIIRRFRRKGAAAKRIHPPAWFAFSLYEKVLNKLRTQPVEDFRIDFEDGYGFRGDTAEDRDAVNSARETAHALASGALPPFFGIRIRPVTPEFKVRSLRTLDLYLRELLDQSSGRLPAGFVVTLPKISSVGEVETLADRLDDMEKQSGVIPGSIGIELMVEHPRVLTSDTRGTLLIQMIRSGRGRTRGVHLGLYDFLSSLGIVASMQSFRHPSADHLRSVTSEIAASEGVWVSDGAVNTIPVGPHSAAKLSRAMMKANDLAVWSGWNEIYGHIMHSLRFGYYQGWDLHPSQLIPRYAAVYTLFLRELDRATQRLVSFLDDAALARRNDQEFDDVATALGLLQFFAKGYACGAFSGEDLENVGLTPEELREGSVSRIVSQRTSENKKRGATNGPPVEEKTAAQTKKG